MNIDERNDPNVNLANRVEHAANNLDHNTNVENSNATSNNNSILTTSDINTLDADHNNISNADHNNTFNADHNNTSNAAHNNTFDAGHDSTLALGLDANLLSNNNIRSDNNHRLVTAEQHRLLSEYYPDHTYPFPLDLVEFKWFHATDGMIAYEDPAISYFLYVCFLLNYTEVEIEINNRIYIVNFVEFIQTNKNTNFRRHIIYGPKNGYSSVKLPPTESWYWCNHVDIINMFDMETTWQLTYWPSTRSIQYIVPLGFFNYKREYVLALFPNKTIGILYNKCNFTILTFFRRDFLRGASRCWPYWRNSYKTDFARYVPSKRYNLIHTIVNTHQPLVFNLDFIQKTLESIAQVSHTFVRIHRLSEYVFPNVEFSRSQQICAPKSILEQCNITFQPVPSSVTDTCSICFENISSTPLEVQGIVHNSIKLEQCNNHYFHDVCITGWIKNTHLNCPICGCTYGGIRTGNQPKGMMTTYRIPDQLPTFQCHTIVIEYTFPNGIQDNTHPFPGQPFSGNTRLAYLPDNKEGEELLSLLEVAWQRRLLFTVGYSTTYGVNAGVRVIWNGVHHKTAMSGEYGYPDLTYPARVKSELAQLGVVV